MTEICQGNIIQITFLNTIAYVFELAEWSRALRVIESRVQKYRMKILNGNLRQNTRSIEESITQNPITPGYGIAPQQTTQTDRVQADYVP